jgi:hypothetical protein
MKAVQKVATDGTEDFVDWSAARLRNSRINDGYEVANTFPFCHNEKVKTNSALIGFNGNKKRRVVFASCVRDY